MYKERSEDKTLTELKRRQETIWLNPHRGMDSLSEEEQSYYASEAAEAAERMERFAPLMEQRFPELTASHGRIRSQLREIPAMQKVLQRENSGLQGKLLIKLDSDLPVAGSVKARGGIHEVLKHTEELAIAGGILKDKNDDCTKLLAPQARAFFAQHKVQVGSTGNLGMSIGIMSAALGYQAIVHMSADAKQWKKDLLRSHGVTVKEYTGDYGLAVKSGREESLQDPDSYFVDDESSVALFAGYTTAGREIAEQLAAMQIKVDREHPLFVYLPCGVGGAPGGIAYGLRLQFGEAVHPFFVEPVDAPCVTLGLATGFGNQISVQDIGLSGKTEADGLAVGRASGLVCKALRGHVSGCLTVADERLTPWLRELWSSEKIFIEPSACAAFAGPALLNKSIALQEYAEKQGITPYLAQSTHIVWATGGSLVPQRVRYKLLGLEK